MASHHVTSESRWKLPVGLIAQRPVLLKKPPRGKLPSKTKEQLAGSPDQALVSGPGSPERPWFGFPAVSSGDGSGEGPRPA